MTRARGFTLLELLVAMAYGGLNTVLEQRDIADDQAERWKDVQLAIGMITRDLRQIHPRPVRDEIGDAYEPAVLAARGTRYALQVTRGGWSNPAGHPRSTLQRVAYRLEDGELLRVHWPVLDRTLATEPVITRLLADVAVLELRLMDWQGQWHDQWPPPDTDLQHRLRRMPRAIEFSVELQDLGRIWRLVESSS